MAYRICLLPGDGIGPEVMAEAQKVLDAVASRFDLAFEYDEQLLGDTAVASCGSVLPQATLEAVHRADAILVGAIGSPGSYDADPQAPRPLRGLVDLQRELGLFVRICPVHVFPSLVDASSLKPEYLSDVDIALVYDAVGGLLSGAQGRETGVQGASSDGGPGRCAFDALDYSESEVEQVARSAFELARSRGGHLHSIDDAGSLETSRLWREVVHEVAGHYPDVGLTDMSIGDAAFQMVSYPAQFDVVVSESTLGSILSSEAAILAGSSGMVATASLGPSSSLHMPLPVDGGAEAGTDMANPLAMILSVETMLRYGLDLPAAANSVLVAINRVLSAGYRTADLADVMTPDDRVVGTGSMGDLVASQIGAGSR